MITQLVAQATRLFAPRWPPDAGTPAPMVLPLTAAAARRRAATLAAAGQPIGLFLGGLCVAQGDGGHIINVSSVAGHKVGPGGAVYSATKHAVRVISEGLRQEVKPYDIRTTVISPGAVATELPSSATEPDVADNLHKFYDEYAIPADSFARAVAFAMEQPDDIDINEILFRPTRQML